MFAARIALLFFGCLAGSSALHASVMSPFFSELHYDNAGADVGEFVAISGPSGLDVEGWQVALYNGATGRPYRSLALHGAFDGPPGGLTELAITVAGIQNGPDALALISDLGDVMDFIAYEGAVSASVGAAAGMSARVLPLSQGDATAVGESLQRTGALDAWDWFVGPSTPGIVNAGLRISNRATVAVPFTAMLMLAGLVGRASLRRRDRGPG